MATPTLWGTNFLVNTTTLGTQEEPQVTALADGRFIVTWTDWSESEVASGPFTDVRAQLFNADGTKKGGEIILGSGDGKFVAGAQLESAVTALPDGRVIVLWSEIKNDGKIIHGQVLSIDGEPLSTFSLGTSAAFVQFPTITMMGPDRFMVGWQEGTDGGPGQVDIFTIDDASIINQVASRPLAGEFVGGPSVASLSDSAKSVAVWADGLLGVRAEAIGPTGAGDGAFPVASGENMKNATVTALKNGGFVVTWQKFVGLPPTGAYENIEIHARVYNSAFSAVTGDILVSTAGREQVMPAVTALNDGRFVITWSDNSRAAEGFEYDIRGQVFSENGVKDGAQFSVHNPSGQQQKAPSITTLVDGRLVFAWHSDNGDVSGTAIHAQIVEPREMGINLPGTALNDHYIGTRFADVINGAAGHDSLIGGDGNDTLNGGTENDTIDGGASADVIDGGDGIDTASFQYATAGVVANLDTDGTVGEAAGDIYTNIENLLGSAYADTLVGNGAVNVLTGGGGNDWLEGGAGGDALQGGSGIDTAAFQGSAAAVYVNLSTGTGAGGDAAGDVYSSIENLYGSVYADKLVGNSAANVIKGQTGNDQLLGAAGADLLYGGLGNDVLYGGTENDTLLGEAGADTLYGEYGDDRLYGGTENDLLSGSAGNDTLKGDAGNDKLYGGIGKDVLYGGVGYDIFVFDTALNRTSNVDRILDYSVAHDTLWLDNRYMPKLGSGSAAKPVKLNAAYFAYDVAKDANDHLIYNRKSGVLSYDADGSGAGRAVEIAILKPGLGLTYHDVYVI